MFKEIATFPKKDIINYTRDYSIKNKDENIMKFTEIMNIILI